MRGAWILGGWVLVGALLPQTGFAGTDTGDLFVNGVTFYEKGMYADARESFERVLDKGWENASLYYNLGNSYVRLGQKGKAIWAYERALRLDPRDEDIRWNLEVLNKQVADEKEKSIRLLDLGWFLSLTGYIRSDELAYLFGGGVFALSLGFLGFAFVTSARVVFRKLLTLVLVYTLVTGGLVGLRVLETKDTSAIIGQREVYAHYGPSPDATKAFLLHEGAKVTIVDESQGWASIRFGDKQRGWIAVDSILKV